MSKRAPGRRFFPFASSGSGFRQKAPASLTLFEHLKFEAKRQKILRAFRAEAAHAPKRVHQEQENGERSKITWRFGAQRHKTKAARNLAASVSAQVSLGRRDYRLGLGAVLCAELGASWPCV